MKLSGSVGGVNVETHFIFAVVLLLSNTPSPLSYHGWALLSLTLFSLCVAGRACVTQLTVRGGGGGEKNPNKTTANTLGLFLYIHLTGWVKQEKDHRECCAGWCPGGSPWRNCPPSPTSLPPMCRKPSALGCYILPLTSTMVFRTRIPEISVYLFTFRIWSEKKIIYRIRSVDGAAALWFPGSPSVKGQCQKSRYGR
jgi:hypothetical protein